MEGKALLNSPISNKGGIQCTCASPCANNAFICLFSLSQNVIWEKEGSKQRKKKKNLHLARRVRGTMRDCKVLPLPKQVLSLTLGYILSGTQIK